MLSFDVYQILSHNKTQGLEELSKVHGQKTTSDQKVFFATTGEDAKEYWLHETGELKLVPERCQCGGRSYSKWEAVPESGSIVWKGSIKMRFRLMNPRVEDENI